MQWRDQRKASKVFDVTYERRYADQNDGAQMVQKEGSGFAN